MEHGFLWSAYVGRPGRPDQFLSPQVKCKRGFWKPCLFGMQYKSYWMSSFHAYTHHLSPTRLAWETVLKGTPLFCATWRTWLSQGVWDWSHIHIPYFFWDQSQKPIFHLLRPVSQNNSFVPSEIGLRGIILYLLRLVSETYFVLFWDKSQINNVCSFMRPVSEANFPFFLDYSRRPLFHHCREQRTKRCRIFLFL